MTPDRSMTGKRVKKDSWDGRLRARLSLPIKQLYLLPDLETKEPVVSWRITKIIKNGVYMLEVKTKKRTMNVGSNFFAWMNGK